MAKPGLTKSLKFKRSVRRFAYYVPQDSPVDPSTLFRGLLDAMWDLTAREAPRGNLGEKCCDDEIAEEVGWRFDPEHLIDILVELHWLDRDDRYRLIVHDWNEHAPTYVKGNVTRMVPPGFVQDEPKRSPENVPKEGTKLNASDRPKAVRKTPPRDDPKTNANDGPSLSSVSLSLDTTPSVDWQAVEDFLLQIGMVIASETCKAARDKGCSPAQVQELVFYWESQRPAWDIGALALRIQNLRPGQDITAVWPPPSTAKQAEDRRAREEQKRRDEASETARRTEANLAEESANAAREEKFGAMLDAMDGQQIRNLTAKHCGILAVKYLGRWSKTCKVEGQHRKELLYAIDERESAKQVVSGHDPQNNAPPACEVKHSGRPLGIPAETQTIGRVF